MIKNMRGKRRFDDGLNPVQHPKMRYIKPERKTDKTGSQYELAECRSGDFSSLMAMYDLFSPRPASQGLPPVQTKACQKWVKDLINVGENFLTWRDKKVIGHAALIPDLKKGDCEFVIFIDQLYRNRGIGTGLSQLVITRARMLGLKSIWATVEIHNIRAMSLCKKLGFEFCDADDCERIMALRLDKNV
jgi:GNAT superfamily N-acetyltransferase